MRSWPAAAASPCPAKLGFRRPRTFSAPGTGASDGALSCRVARIPPQLHGLVDELLLPVVGEIEDDANLVDDVPQADESPLLRHGAARSLEVVGLQVGRRRRRKSLTMSLQTAA